MIRVEYPEPHFKRKKENGKPFIFCAIRKRWISLTEEEWVRQNFVQYLIQILSYPAALIAVEKELTINELKKRFDILVYDKEHQPWMLIECKEPATAINENVLQQVLRYSIQLSANYIVLTNGNNTIAWRKKRDSLELISELPHWIA